ncbi:MAG TPA: zinc ABC transporter substrate-binding protein [Candidatus Polarisedimenticolaceae bacterium]|nr:zinc ABC transporter substrate-binding protein [Candidatus Polarisedimenticolaceae bacterium]
MSKTPFASLAGLLVLHAIACGGGDAASPDRRLLVVTTTGIVGDMARRIAGGDAEVVSLMGPGVDPHLYKASESDVRRLAEADLILYNGLHLEGKMGDILVKMARSRPVVAVTETIPDDRLREPPEFAGQYDPHVWFDVDLWSSTIAPIVDALGELAPERATSFRDNGDRLRDELRELDSWIERRIGELPEERRILVTAHDAFGYFGRRYGMRVVGLQGISTLDEAGLKDVDRVVDLVVGERVSAIFVESSVPRRSIEAVQAAAAERGHRVAIGAELYSDALGAGGTPAGTYIGMVRHNVDSIVQALQ